LSETLRQCGNGDVTNRAIRAGADPLQRTVAKLPDKPATKKKSGGIRGIACQAQALAEAPYLLEAALATRGDYQRTYHRSEKDTRRNKACLCERAI
jgi:hypothetical protein